MFARQTLPGSAPALGCNRVRLAPDRERFHRPSAAFFRFWPARARPSTLGGECAPRDHAPDAWRNQRQGPKAIGYWYNMRGSGQIALRKQTTSSLFTETSARSGNSKVPTDFFYGKKTIRSHGEAPSCRQTELSFPGWFTVKHSITYPTDPPGASIVKF